MPSLTLCPPLPVEAARTRKPNRRRGSCSPVAYLRSRQIARLDAQAVSYGADLVAGNPSYAADLAEAIRLAFLTELASPWPT